MKKTSALSGPGASRPKVPRPRGRPRSFDRDAALEAAMTVFWNKGFEGTSISDLTAAMGINPPSLYAAFGDKEGLFLEAVERYEERQGEACPYCEEPTARASVERLLRDMAAEFTSSCHPRGCMMVMATATSAASTRRLQKALTTRREAGRARLRARIERGIADRDLPADTDVAALSDFYMAVIVGMSLQAREGATRKALLAMVETAMRAWPQSHAGRKARASAVPA
jgi:TetR/AcrR family transcriptional regulator, copper-responsive repressor